MRERIEGTDFHGLFCGLNAISRGATAITTPPATRFLRKSRRVVIRVSDLSSSRVSVALSSAFLLYPCFLSAFIFTLFSHEG